MSITKKQRAYAARLGRDTARYEQDNKTAFAEHPTPDVLFWQVTALDLRVTGRFVDGDVLAADWAAGYRKQVELYESCDPHQFDSGRALSPTENARCKRCHVSIMSGYLLPLEGES